MVKVFVITPNNADEENEILSQSWDNVHSIFLAGTIDNGNSENWQEKQIELIKARYNEVNELPFGFETNEVVLIYNPRNDNWDASNSDDEEAMNKQISWELEHLEKATEIIMNLLPNSKSPISLLELGLFGGSGKMTVYCTKDFYRYFNVKVTCNRYNIKLVEKNL